MNKKLTIELVAELDQSFSQQAEYVHTMSVHDTAGPLPASKSLYNICVKQSGI